MSCTVCSACVLCVFCVCAPCLVCSHCAGPHVSALQWIQTRVHMPAPLGQYVDPRPGNFIDLETREVVGRHNGIHQWTIGQRCNIAGLPEAYFVAEKLTDSGDILVVRTKLAELEQTVFSWWIQAAAGAYSIRPIV